MTDHQIHLHPDPSAPAPHAAPAASELAAGDAAPGGRIGVLKPLRQRDFALLWAGMTVSLLGDGIYLVALAFQVYELSNSPTALSIVFFAWTAPMVAFFLIAGVLSDRLERKRLLIASDVIRGLSITAMGFLSVTGDLTLTHLLVLAAIYGVGDALFMPAFTSIVPDIVPKSLLLEANALDNFVRPLMMRFAGPALGGLIVAGAGAGVAFLADGATFVLSAAFIAFIKPRKRAAASDRQAPLKEIREGFRFVKRHTWIWATLCSAAISLLCFIGPMEVLIPYVVKNDLGGGAAGFGTILAMGGVGAVLTSLLMGQRGLPRKHMLFMFGSWGAGILLLSTFALVEAVWQAAAVSFLMTSLFTMGMIVWGTLMHRLVPGELLGRVSSLDWLVSTAFVPVSFILTGPIADRIGVNQTLLWAGVLGSIATVAFLFVPGVRDTERELHHAPVSGPALDPEGTPTPEPIP